MHNAVSYLWHGAFRCLLLWGHFWRAVVFPEDMPWGVALSRNAIKQLGPMTVCAWGASVLYPVNKNGGMLSAVVCGKQALTNRNKENGRCFSFAHFKMQCLTSLGGRQASDMPKGACFLSALSMRYKHDQLVAFHRMKSRPAPSPHETIQPGSTARSMESGCRDCAGGLKVGQKKRPEAVGGGK